MRQRANTQMPGQGDGGILAAVIGEDHLIDNLMRDLRVGTLQRSRRIIRGQNHGDALALQHRGRPVRRRRASVS